MRTLILGLLVRLLEPLELLEPLGLLAGLTDFLDFRVGLRVRVRVLGGVLVPPMVEKGRAVSVGW